MNSSLETRVAVLERRLRLYQILTLVTVLACCMGAKDQPTVEPEVRARQFVVVDSKGKPVASLAGGPHGGVLELREYHRGTTEVGFRAESGELKISDVAHEDELLWVGLLGTHCFGQWTLQPPASTGADPHNGFTLDCSTGLPSARVQGGQRHLQMQVGPQEIEFDPKIEPRCDRRNNKAGRVEQ